MAVTRDLVSSLISRCDKKPRPVFQSKELIYSLIIITEASSRIKCEAHQRDCPQRRPARHYKICHSLYSHAYSTNVYKKSTFLYQSMKHFHTNRKYFLMCISEFYLCANATKYINTKMSLFSCFLHTCEQLDRKFLL